VSQAKYTSMLNCMGHYPSDAARVMVKGERVVVVVVMTMMMTMTITTCAVTGGGRVTIEFPDLHYNRATVLKYLEECVAHDVTPCFNTAIR